jgi:hypothetical protein
MSYTFLVAQGEESSADCFSDIPPSALSKSSHIAERFCSNGSATESCPGFQFGTTLQHSTAYRGAELQTLCAADSHVKTFHAQEKATDLKENAADFGARCGESLARYYPHTFSWRTAQCCLFGGLSKFSETWPRWGIVAHGELFQADTLVPQLKENDFLLPAPTKSMGKRGWGMSNQKARYSEKLESNARLFGYKPHPSVLEWSMGWIVTWTRLQPLAMDKYQQWQQRHGTSCAKEPPPEYCGNGQHSIQQRQYAIPLDIKE